MATETRSPSERRDRARETEVRFIPLGSGIFLDRQTGQITVL